MIDYLLSFQAPVKGEALAGTGLPSLVTNLALAAGFIIFKPVVDQFIGLTINHHTPTTFDNRQSMKAILDAGHDLLSPALDGLSTLHLEDKATITTAVTVIKGVPTPVQLFQEQSIMGGILSICACAVLALVGTALVFQYSGQGTYISGTSPPPASSDNGGSSPQPFSRGSTPPTDDLSDEPSGWGSGGRPPPVPIYDIFYDIPISRLDKAVDTNDEKGIRDMDGAPPPPPPSFPTPVEDGDSFKKSSVIRWSSLTLVLSIISLVINRLFNRFSKNSVKTQTKVSTPTASERITVNEISGGAVTPIPFPIAKPVIKTTSPNMLPPVETESLGASISTLVKSTVSQRLRRFTNFVIFVLVFTCLLLLPFFLHDYLDNHLENITNYFFPMETREQSLKTSDVVEITDDDVAASIDEEDIATGTNEEDTAGGIDEEDTGAGTDQGVAAGTQEEDVAGINEEDVAAGVTAGTDDEAVAARTDEANVATGGDEETDDLMNNSVEQEISFNHVVGAGDATLVVYENASPLAVDLKDIFSASEDGIPFHEVFSALSISSSSDKIPAFKEGFFTTPRFKLPTELGKKCTVNGSQDIKVLSEHVLETNIPVVAEQVHTVSKFILEKAASIVGKVSSTAKVDTTSKENIPIVNINKASFQAPDEPLSVLMRSFAKNRMKTSTERLNPKAASAVPRVPAIQQPGPSSSTSLHYCYSPPSPLRPGLSASMHAPSPVRKGLSSSIHAPSSSPMQELSASIHAPSPPPMQELSDSIHAPCTPPSTPAPIEHVEPPSEPIPIPVVDLSPDRRIRRVIDPRRECNVIVIIGGDSQVSA